MREGLQRVPGETNEEALPVQFYEYRLPGCVPVSLTVLPSNEVGIKGNHGERYVATMTWASFRMLARTFLEWDRIASEEEAAQKEDAR